MAVQSLATAVQLEALNFAAMALMGMVLFFIGKLVFEIRFVRFMAWLDHAFKSVLQGGSRRIQNPRYAAMLDLLEHMNPMLDALNDTKMQADRLRDKAVAALKKERLNQGRTSPTLEELADEIKHFTDGQFSTNQE